jgi:hypothetical protein
MVACALRQAMDATREARLAGAWPTAIENRNLDALARLTSCPLEVRDVRREAHCGRRTAIIPN